MKVWGMKVWGMKVRLTVLLWAIVSVNLMIAVQGHAHAAPPTAEIEQRARQVGQSLRCVVCQNQSIDESDAPLAKDMRRLVRAQMRAGKSDAEVMAFMQDRYGDYVLLKPPMQSNTYILWFAPFILLLSALVWYLVFFHKTPADVQRPAALTDTEKDRLRRLKEEDEL